MTKKRSTRRKAAKFTGSAKVTLTALSLLGFVGSWNLIGRMENPAAQAQTPLPTTTPPPAAIQSPPTPWPTIAPLADIPPIPTLAPFDSGQPAAANIANDTTIIDMPALQPAAPLPTLAPLPPMPEMPAAPPPPPPAPAGGWQDSGGWQNSGGS